jgi:hypothetical protein
MAAVARSTLQALVSWNGYVLGQFTIGFSTIGGTDALGNAPSDQTFTGLYDDVSKQCRGYSFTRGRGTNPGEMQPGSGSLEIDDNLGVLNPANPTGPLYGVLSDRLHPCVIRHVYNGVTYPRFWGWARTPIYKPGTRKGRVTVQLVDMWYWLNRANPVIASTGATTTGAAISLVLDAVGWPKNQRIIDAGDDIPGFSADGSVSAQQLVVNLVQSETGTMWQDAVGNAVYRDRTYRITRTSQATIADVMHGLQPTGDISDVFNRVQITRTQSGHVATAQDAIVAARIGYNDLAFDSPYFTSDVLTDQRADWILSQRKQTRPPADDFTIDNRTPALLTEILQRDLVDRITVTESATHTAGDWHVDGMTETLAEDGTLTSQRQLSMASTLNAFRIGISALDGGVLI